MTSVLEEKIRALQDSQTRLEEAYTQLKNDTLKREETNRDLSRKINELTSLGEVTQIITDSLNIDTVLDTIVDTIGQVMGFDTCSIKLLDRRTGDLCVTVSRGLGEEYSRKDATPMGEGVSGRAVKMCRPIFIQDVASDARIEKGHILHRIGVKSMISFPLVTRKSVVGVLNLYTRETHEFTEDERRLLTIFANQAASAIENARLFDSLRDSYLHTIQALSMAIDAKDRYTHGHSERVSKISVMIGRQLGLTPDKLDLLKYAGDLHDIGKIGVSELIIAKESKLTVDEYEIIKTHPLVGEVIIEPVPFLRDARAVIRHHHERWDGYGYPDGLKGEEIPLLSRIILIADAYDAMTSDRPYRKALTHSVAVHEIERHSSTQFDPQVVRAFLELFREKTPEDVIAAGEGG
jgi:HD-GYP domain-containing protein (c-di-GMP phosphodiesterase class II)